MARKTEKDYKIEALQSEVDNLKERDSLRKSWESLSDNLKLGILIAIILICIAIFICFYLEIRNATGIGLIDEAEYQRIMAKVDSTCWEIAKNSYKDLKDTINNTATGEAFIKASNDSLLLELNGSEYGLYGVFDYQNGYIAGFIAGKYARLVFSESSLGNGRALSLYIDDIKLVFYGK